MADEKEKEATLRGELQRIMSQSKSNPEPIPYWGTGDDMNSQKLSMLFEGHTMLKTDLEDDGMTEVTRVHYYCDNHRAVAADPDAFAMVEDEDGITGVHAAAINGYLDTLKILIERGGASPFTQVRGRVDALQMARRRGHKSVLDYLTSFQGEAGAQKLVAIAAFVKQRRDKLAEQLAQLEGDMSAFHENADVLEPEEEEEEKKKTVEAVAEAREVALRASMKAIQKEIVKSVELIPRKIWRAEWAEIDDKRGVGYYPRKPLAGEEL